MYSQCEHAKQENLFSNFSDGLPFMFLGGLASDARETATTDPTVAARTHRAGAIYGDPTVVVNAWGFSRSGANKTSALPNCSFTLLIK